MKIKAGFIIFCLTLPCFALRAELLITQFYEGLSNDKWLEISNTGSTSIDFATSNLYVSIWQNANTEQWKTNGNTPSQHLVLSSGTLSPGSSFLLSHGSAALPGYATADLTNSSVINFNGDDSVVLYNSNSWSTADIIDAISFTDSGSEGTDTSIYRLGAGMGYSLTANSTFEDFTSVWTQTSIGSVDSAGPTDEIRLGYSAIPEPASLFLASLLGLCAFCICRIRPT